MLYPTISLGPNSFMLLIFLIDFFWPWNRLIAIHYTSNKNTDGCKTHYYWDVQN